MARSSVTAQQLLFDAKGLLGNRESINPNATEGIRFINYSLFTLSNLLDGLYRQWETKTSTLTLTSGKASVGVQGGSGHSYAYATRVVTFAGAHGLDTSAHLRGLLLFYNSSTGKGYAGVIESIPSTTTVVLVSDPVGANIASPNLYIATVFFPWYFNGGNVASLNIKKVLAVKDATNGDLVRLNPHEMEDFDQNINMSSSVGLWDFGDGIHARLGSSITTFGTLTLYYCSDPTEVTALTDSIDIESEHHKALVEDIARQIEKAYPGLGKRPMQNDPFAHLRDLYQSIETSWVSKRLKLDVPNKEVV